MYTNQIFTSNRHVKVREFFMSELLFVLIPFQTILILSGSYLGFTILAWDIDPNDTKRYKRNTIKSVFFSFWKHTWRNVKKKFSLCPNAMMVTMWWHHDIGHTQQTHHLSNWGNNECKCLSCVKEGSYIVSDKQWVVSGEQ